MSNLDRWKNPVEMVNYQYDLSDIERNHEAFAESRTVIASSAVTRLARAAARDMVPVS